MGPRDWADHMRRVGFNWRSTGEHWWRVDKPGGDTRLVQKDSDGAWYATAYHMGTSWGWRSDNFDTPVAAAVYAELNNWGR